MQIYLRLGLCCALLGLSLHASSAALVLRPVQVAPKVYAVIGDLSMQSYENEGLNNNLGFIVTSQGVVVLNSGPSVRVARALHEAIKKVTAQPVKWLINGNSQSHYWLGNAYFKQLNVPILAHPAAEKTMQEMGAAQLQSTKSLLIEKADQTTLAYPTQSISRAHTLKLGDTVIEIHYFGPAHTQGDLVLWLPQQKILFSGDLVFTERMLGILPIGDTAGWVQAFERAMALQPKIIIPGHGHPSDIKKARADTKAYLEFLRNSVKAVLAKNGSLQDAVDGIDQARFKYLLNFDLLAKRNVNQVYTELEQTAF